MTDDEKQKIIETARSLEIMLCDPAIERWFDAEAYALTTAMVEADVGDDDARRAAVLELRALKKLKNSMQTAISRARHIEKTGEAK